MFLSRLVIISIFFGVIFKGTFIYLQDHRSVNDSDCFSLFQSEFDDLSDEKPSIHLICIYSQMNTIHNQITPKKPIKIPISVDIPPPQN